MPELKDDLSALRIEREPERQRRGRWIIWVGLLVLLGAAGAAAARWAMRERPIEVEVAAVSERAAGTQAVVLNASGYVTARRRATVSSKITGKVVEVNVEEGMAVKEGQVLARLDDATFRASLSLAEAQAEAARRNVRESEVRLAEAKLALGRVMQLVKDQLAEQRRFMLATFEAFARRMSSEIKEMTRVAPPPPAEPLPPPSAGIPWWPVALTALLAVVPSVILGFLYWQSIGTTAALASSLAETKAQLASAEAAALAAAAPVGDGDGSDAGTVGSSPPSGPLAVEYVPYGEIPLSGERLERLRELAATLESQQFRGRVVVETHTGDFCLSGGTSEGFEPTAAARPSVECDVIGNPFDDSLTAARHQSVDFANFVATLRQRSGGAVEVQIVNADRRHAIPYPKPREGSTAGDWNAVAVQNNRVEFRVVPAG
jgi:multidrug efflux pump subunit AcrA (membrane-fusion protein)